MAGAARRRRKTSPCRLSIGSGSPSREITKVTSMKNRLDTRLETNACSKHKRRRLSVGLRYAGAALVFGLTAACASPEERLENYTESGQEFLAEGDLGRANIQFQNALKINEEHVPALLGLVEIAEQENDFGQMFGVLQRVIRLDPENVDALVKMGKLYLVASDETAAIENADKALAIDPNSIDAKGLKAAVQLKLGDTVGAVELARQVVAEDPANPQGVTVLATERTLVGELDEAIEILEGAIELTPDQAILQLLRISILERLGRNDDVTDAYVQLIEVFPEQSAYRRAYAIDLIEREDYGAALTQLEKIAELEPENLDAKLDVIRVVMNQSGEDAARERLQAYVDANQENVDLKFALVEFLRQADDLEESAAELAKLEQSDDLDVSLRAKNEIAANLLRDKKFDEGRALIAEILKADERNTDALIKRAGLAVEDGEYDTAILDLRTALDNSPDSAEAMVLMALAFERQDNPSFARAEFAKAFDASGRDAGVGLAFAKFHLRQQDVQRAEAVLIDTQDANPGDLETLQLLAGVRLSQQNWRGAEEIAGILERLENQNELAERIKSAAYAGLGDYDRMIDTLSAQNENEPLASQPLATLVGAYIRSDRADEAQELLSRIIDTQEDSYDAHILLAQVYGSKQQTQDAVDILNAATERDPARPEAYELLYRFYQRSNQSEEAKALIESGLEKAPDNTALRVFQADSLLSDGRNEEALAMYDELVDEFPENLIVANNFVSLSSDLRQDSASIARALEVAQTLEEVDNPLFLDTIGWAYYRAGQFDEAVEFLSRAAEDAGDNAEIMYHLGAAYFAAGDVENARTTLQRALNAGGDGFKYADEINDLLART